MSIVSSLIAIVICAGLGTLIASAVGSALEWQGAWVSFATLLLSMFFAFVFFVIGVVLLRILHIDKRNN